MHTTENMMTCETQAEFNSLRDRRPNNPGELEFHREFLEKNYNISAADVGNTFKYIFNKFKKGIYVKVVDGELASFIPFDNRNYTNEFSHLLKPPPTHTSLVHYLTSVGQPPLLPPEKWYANNSMFRTDYFKGNNNLEILKKWMMTLCHERNLHDIEFFINRRDFPLMKKDALEPYDHIYGTAKLVSHNYDKYTPIISFSTDDTFADVMLPTFEDWARVWFQEDGVTVPKQHRAYPVIESKPWDEKKPIVFFRGQSTGSGFDIDTNQRLKAYAIGSKRRDLFDVQFNKLSYRFRKHSSSLYIRAQEFPGQFVKAKYVSAQQQSDYKFILNLEGHVAAFRLSYELSFNSCILLAESRWKMWYSHMLEPWVHYVPVKQDLSDLVEKAEWCKRNDTKCREIAENGVTFYKQYLGKQYMLDFCQQTLNKLALHCGAFNHTEAVAKVSDRNLAESFEKRLAESMMDLPEGIPSGKQNFERSIENLDAVAVVVNKHYRNLTFNKMENSLNKFANINGCLIQEELENKSTTAAQVGYFCINKVLADIPNFLYTFVVRNRFIRELIPAIKMDFLLKSCTLDDFKSILLQVVCSLIHAQNKVGFVHGKMSTQSVSLSLLETPMTIAYQISPTHNLVHTTKFLVIISDYSDSRGVAYDPEKGYLTSIGNLHLEFSKINDTRDFLDNMIEMLKSVNPFFWDFFMTKIYNPFLHKTSCFNIVQNILKSGLQNTWWDNKPFSVMQKGNTVYTIARINGMQHKDALQHVISHLNKHGTLDSDSQIFRNIQSSLFKHRTKWLNRIFLESPLKQKWLKYVTMQMPKRRALDVTLSFRYPAFIYDEAINDYVEMENLQVYDGDLVTVLDLMYFAFRMNILSTEFGDFFAVEPFDLMTNIANINDRHKPASVPDVLIEEIIE